MGCVVSEREKDVAALLLFGAGVLALMKYARHQQRAVELRAEIAALEAEIDLIEHANALLASNKIAARA